jgi:hypothetical protein
MRSMEMVTARCIWVYSIREERPKKSESVSSYRLDGPEESVDTHPAQADAISAERIILPIVMVKNLLI